METAPTTASDPTPPEPARRRPPWRQIRRQAATLVASIATVVLVSLCISTLAVWLQGRRDEARSADVLFVAAPELPSEALVEHSFELFLRGYAPQVVVVGQGGEGLRALLLERGVPEAAVVAATGADLQAKLAAAAAARQSGAGSALVAGAPAELLLWLKLTRDMGLRSYGAPTPGEAPALPELVGAGARYWRYALLQR
jgi:hypothetical protein